MNSTSKIPEVAILLCTYNGEKHLKEQLDSIKQQTHAHWRVIVSDDGSNDGTMTILKAYQRLWGSDKLEIRLGPQQHFSSNFLSMACDPTIQADYYCFCDQDDVWLERRLEMALLRAVEHENPKKPFVYCGRTQYVSDTLQVLGPSTLYLRAKTFSNALIQSIAGGNTMMFNQRTKQVLEETGVRRLPGHDWWVYLLVTGTDGVVYYDSTPFVLYRQHASATYGGNRSLSAKLDRLKRLFNGGFKDWCDTNNQALLEVQELLTPKHRIELQYFSELRRASFVERCILLIKLRLYRQSLIESLFFCIAILLRKI